MSELVYEVRVAASPTILRRRRVSVTVVARTGRVYEVDWAFCRPSRADAVARRLVRRDQGRRRRAQEMARSYTVEVPGA